MTVAAIFHRPPTGPDADRDLLRRFADRRDDGAFAALVHRYGRLVFATCLRVLSHRADAEDAYQATFLVLARRCGAIRSDEKLAGWLHTVAVRTATEVRRMRDRRRRAEATPSLTLPAPTDPLESRELAAVLDEELAKLPDHYRLAVVLCELNGVGRKAAAKELGVAEGTLSSRLAKARKLLADRLTGRGFGAVSAAALTAALANSAVARIPAAGLDFGAADGILNITIQSVADTVVKAMFATKLKAGAVVAVLLALAGGVVWTTAAGAGPGDGPVPAKEKPDPAEPLVAQLGSKEFAEREAAEKSLRELGAAAFAAVTAGLNSDNPEVVKRCQKLFGQFRKDDLDKFVAAFKKDADFRQPFDHPLWLRWAEVIGTTRGCRELFDEMLLVPDAADLLDELDKKPERAKDVYKGQLLKWNALVEKRCRAHGDPNKWLSSNLGYSTGERTFLAYLATFPGTENVFGTESSEIECNPIGELPEVHFRMPGPVDLNGPMGQLRLKSVQVGTEAQKWRCHRIQSPAKWLFLKAFATRTHPQTLIFFLQHAGSLKAEDRASLARTIFGDQSVPVRTRAYTLGTLVDIDAVDLLPALAKLRDDATAFERFIDGKPEVEYSLQVRDLAVAAMLLLHKQDLRQFGFPKMIAEGIADFRQNNRVAQSFPDDASRKAMHEKATVFLAKAGKPEKRREVIDPAIQALIEQLGDKRVAKRDEAEKALIALGEKARLALFNGWGRANPEIAERCERLFHQLNDARKKGAPKKDDPAPALVQQLGSKDFAEREAAEKALKEMGAAAFAAVTAGLTSDNPEIVRRCQKLIGVIHKDIREAFAKDFLADKEQSKAFAHPIWQRFVALAGDSKASRAVFAELLKYKHPDGLEVLDAADRDPAKADELYRDHVSAVGKRVAELSEYSFSIRDLVPGHTTDIAAYTLFLGSIRTSATDPKKLPVDDRIRYTNGRNTILQFGDGLKEGLKGNVMVTSGPQVPKGKLRAAVPGPEGTDKVFARLASAFVAADWLPEDLWYVADPFEAAPYDHRLPLSVFRDELTAEALPTARRTITDKTRPPQRRAVWIPILRRCGDATDAVRLATLFGETALLPHRNNNFTDLTRVEVREWAIGTALVLRGKNPADVGFDRFPKVLPDRKENYSKWHPGMFAIREPQPHWFQGGTFGQPPRDPAAKEKVLKAAIEWLDEESRKEKEPPKQADPAPALVARLGSKEFAEREAAEKALRALGAAAFAAVTAGQKSDNPEIVRRCQKLMPTLRAAHLARPESEVWKRFIAIAGDTPHARELFLDMVAEPERVVRLMAENPAKEYAALVETTVKTLREKYDGLARNHARTGLDWVSRLVETSRGDMALLFFLGSSPETAETAPKIDERDRSLWHNYLQEAFMAGKPEGRKFPPEARQLIAAWLGGRTDQRDVRAGLMFARFHRFAEILPVARAMLTDDRRTTAERTPALYALAQIGTQDDLKRVVPFLDSDAVYLTTKYTHTDGKSHPLTVEVRDVAHAAVGKLLGADLADLGFEFCQKGDADDALAFRYDHFAGFTTADKRAAAHANVRKLLKNAPVPKDFGPPKRPKLPKAAPPGARVKAAMAELDDALAGRRERDPPGMERKLEALVTATKADEDKARLYHHAAYLLTNSTSPNFARAGELATKCLAVGKDPVLRWKARSLQASAIYKSGVKFDEGRRKQAEVLLTGYVELLAQDLPDADPEWPTMRKLRLPEAGPDGDPVERAAILAERDAQDKARANAEFVKEQVFGRKVLLMQLRDAYKPAPNDPRRTADGPDELRALAAKTMTEREVSTLMKRVLEEK